MESEATSRILTPWLAGVWLFAGATRAELAPLVTAAQAVPFSKGTVIYRRGEPASGLYLLVEGPVGIATRDAQGQRVWGRATAPAIFGELGVLDGVPRASSAIGLADGVAYVVPTPTFRGILERVPSVTMRVVALLAKQTRQTPGPWAELPAAAAWERAGPGQASTSTSAVAIRGGSAGQS